MQTLQLHYSYGQIEEYRLGAFTLFTFTVFFMAEIA